MENKHYIGEIVLYKEEKKDLYLITGSGFYVDGVIISLLRKNVIYNSMTYYSHLTTYTREFCE